MRKIQIQSGSESNGELVGQICEFVIRSGRQIDNLSTKRLYPMLVELMTNTKQHAYNDKGHMISNWYVFAEDVGDEVRFVFLDTGVGIPNTLRYKIVEGLEQFFSN